MFIKYALYMKILRIPNRNFIPWSPITTTQSCETHRRETNSSLSERDPQILVPWKQTKEPSNGIRYNKQAHTGKYIHFRMNLLLQQLGSWHG